MSDGLMNVLYIYHYLMNSGSLYNTAPSDGALAA
jgi:hypothetical protein